MDFVAVVDQAIALLRQRGRLTYGTLKRQFQLDDAALDDLKDELIVGQRLAVDEDGRVLVWTGGSSSAPTTASPLPPSTTLGVAPAQVGGTLVAPPAPEAERRQLTVMFCDLVDSTRLSSQLDPEDWREVVRKYQQVCTAVVQRYEGHIAQLLGDGLLVYLGYPHAHEDDAQRAVRTGLGILAALGDLNSHLQQAKGLQLAVRLGIHTGLVVVGEMGSAGRLEQLALGAVPNIAARLQGLAASNTLVMSDATSRLVQGYFDCEALGEQTLRGVAEPVRLYRVLQESSARGRLDVAVTRGLTPLVGRESEVTLLLERWEQVKAGHGHVVLLTGEAGIGKSRLVQVLKDHVANEPHVRWECRSAEYSQNTALFPLVDLLQRLLRFDAHEAPDAKVAKLEHALSQYRLPLDESVPLFAPLLSLSLPESRYALLNLSPQRQRQKTLDTLVALLLELAERQPVLFIIEDLHWTDPTTLELLNLVIEQAPTASMLVLLTRRPHFQPSWQHRSYLTEMTLHHLSHAQVAQLVRGMTQGQTLPPEVLQQILANLESDQLTVVDGHYELIGSLSTLAIPATLQDSLMARLDRLVTAKAVAQYAAVIGRQFAYELLQAVSQLDEVTLQRELGRLVEAEIVYQRGLPPQATFTFKHALIQDTAYTSLLKSTRQQYHQRIAQVLETQCPATMETQPELLAHHSTEAGRTEQAVAYWQRAGQQAIERSAHVEAIHHLTRGLEVLTTLPETAERLQQALTLHLALGVPLVATKGLGAPEVEHVYTRALDLCQQVGDTPQLFPALWGLWLFYGSRGSVHTAQELATRLLRLAQSVHDPALLLEAYHAHWATAFNLGEYSAARAYAGQGVSLYERQQHHALAFRYGGHDPGVCCRDFGALALWLLGYPAQALQWSQDALTLAHALAHPFSLAEALGYATWLAQFRHEDGTVRTQAEVLMALAQEHGFAYWLAQGQMLWGWARAMQGHGEEGIAHIHQGLGAFQATAANAQPYYLALLAEAYGTIGESTAGLGVLAEALVAVDKTGARGWEVELYRLKGELLLQHATGGSDEAEDCFQQALAIARRQQAKSRELRAAMSLSRLWQQQGKRTEAYELLAPIYEWFTEGFDTADLQEAKALLEELRG